MFSDDRTVRGARRWPLRPAWVVPNEGGDLRASLRSRGAVSWYIGGGLSLLWLFAPLHELVFEPVPDLLGAAHAGWFLALGIGLLVVYALAFLCSAPVVWVLPGRLRPLVPLGLFALSFTLVPWYGWGVRGVWTYVGVAVGMCVLRWRPTMIAIVGLAVLAYLFGIPLAAAGGPDLFLPAIILSISLMMAAFARQLAAMNELRSAQEELQVMAADRERGRIARDMHDLLGHSLTVITVKSELAGRLVDLDPDGAKREIGEIEQLARGALADVRTTVSGFRGASLGRELSAARVALQAAGIRAELPSSVDVVDESHRELAGWVVREGVTNVVRHSEASVCRVTLAGRAVEIADDGVGPSTASRDSTGLAGLRERAEAAGAVLTVGRSELGGFGLRVAW